MAVISVLRPDRGDQHERVPDAAASMAHRSPLHPGATLTLVANGKTHAQPVLELVATEVRRRLPEISQVEVVTKSSPAKSLSDEMAAEIAARADLVIAGLGDCGACSSCSILDAIALERQGVPASVVITEPFVDLVGRFAAMAGMPGYHHVVLPHPVASRSDDELHALAQGVADSLVAQLTTNAVGEPALAIAAE